MIRNEFYRITPVNVIDEDKFSKMLMIYLPMSS